MPKTRIFILIFIVIIVIISLFFIKKIAINKININKTTDIPSISITPTPVFKKTTTLNAEDMNKLYGPCVKLNVLMFHHIEEEVDAKVKNQVSLNVTPEFFRKDLQYLKDKGYEIIEPKDLVEFFNGIKKLAPKSVLITFDDAYIDNYQYAYPLLKEFGYKAVIFTPTGLLDNPDYLNWDQIKSMSDLVYFGNHTWSHHSSAGSLEVLEKEIGKADSQLSEKGLNANKIFAYPYGNPSVEAEKVLREKGYNLAFTTKYGNLLCKGKSLELPRIRIGDAPLNEYGL